MTTLAIPGSSCGDRKTNLLVVPERWRATRASRCPHRGAVGRGCQLFCGKDAPCVQFAPAGTHGVRPDGQSGAGESASSRSSVTMRCNGEPAPLASAASLCRSSWPADLPVCSTCQRASRWSAELRFYVRRRPAVISPHRPLESGDASARDRHHALWGRVPFWSKDAKIGLITINAKPEAVTGLPDLLNQLDC
jgi:hypothetical protein